MPAWLWDKWWAYAAVEPFGPIQEDYRAGLLTTMFHNVHRSGASLKPEELFPSLKVLIKAAGDQKLTAEQFGEFLKAMTSRMGGQVK